MDDMALMAQYKGLCRRCGAYGHKHFNCPNINSSGRGRGRGGGRGFYGKCFYCGKVGHRKSECNKRKRDQAERGDESNDIMLCTLENKTKMDEDLALRVGRKGSDFFICDSGASSHMTNDDSAMFDVKKVDKSIRVGNGEVVQSTKMGNIKTTLVSADGKIMSATITDVIYVPVF